MRQLSLQSLLSPWGFAVSRSNTLTAKKMKTGDGLATSGFLALHSLSHFRFPLPASRSRLRLPA
jgi:predicted MPP superfamily phosphohydrolase